jgi:hypothetical protein
VPIPADSGAGCRVGAGTSGSFNSRSESTILRVQGPK